MIYTVTFNPSIDYIAEVDDYEEGRVNRTNKELFYPGGKGINVSIVLKNLGIDSTAIGFIGGFTGDAIESLLAQIGVNTDFIRTAEGNSRINVKMRTRAKTGAQQGSNTDVQQAGDTDTQQGSDCYTEINGMGPNISDIDIRALFDKLSRLGDGDYLVLAGSIPSSVPNTIYRDIMDFLKDKGVRIIVDATGDLLLNVLEYKPFLVKPNDFELGEIFSVSIDNYDDALMYAGKLQDMGAKNVLVSMGDKGAVLLADKGYSHTPPSGKVINPVGAGDSMVAGFIAGCIGREKNIDYDGTLKMGLCCGSATAFTNHLATREMIDALMKEF